MLHPTNTPPKPFHGMRHGVLIQHFSDLLAEFFKYFCSESVPISEPAINSPMGTSGFGKTAKRYAQRSLQSRVWPFLHCLQPHIGSPYLVVGTVVSEVPFPGSPKLPSLTISDQQCICLVG